MHLGQGLSSPHNTLAVVEVMRGLRRQRAQAGRQPVKKAPLVGELIKRLVDGFDLATLRGMRDRALRRSERVTINLINNSPRTSCEG